MTKIKICGITTLTDARAAIHAGADYLGFNFYPKSPRYIAPTACAEITSVLKREHPRLKLVGVFVNLPVDEVKTILQLCSLDLAQLHGDETPEMLAAFNGKAFKALRPSAHPFPQSAPPLPQFAYPFPQSAYPFPKSAFPLPQSAYPFPKSAFPLPQSAYPLPKSAFPAFLIDAVVKGVYGGSGIPADWNAAAEIASRQPIFLAGGLNPENVAAAIRQVHPWGVDVASGVESAPGVKDAAKMKAFIEAVRETDNQNQE